MSKVINTVLNTDTIVITLPFGTHEHIDLGMHQVHEITLNVSGMPKFYKAFTDTIEIPTQNIIISDSLIINKKTQTLVIDVDDLPFEDMDNVTLGVLDIKQDINYYTV